MNLDLAQRLKQLAAPLPPEAISWRQDGRPGARQGKWFARFVVYTDAQAVRERLDDVFPLEWSLGHDQLPERGDEDGVPEVSMKCRITIRIAYGDPLDTLTITREGIGSGKNYKEAATDSFKRAAVRFGIGAELYDYGPNWVQVDGDGKFAKPVEDPAEAYARKQTKDQRTEAPARRPSPPPQPTVRQQVEAAFPDTRPYDPYEPPIPAPRPAPAPAAAPAFVSTAVPSCPICSGEMWDRRLTKVGKQPDFKCMKKGCDGAVWVPSTAKAKARTAMPSSASYDENPNDFPAALRDEQDDLPF